MSHFLIRTVWGRKLTDRRFQSRAFLILPMTANIGIIIGPMLGGLTSDPANEYPKLFGGIKWLEKYPYSPPNIISAAILVVASISVWLGMEEVIVDFCGTKTSY